MLQVEFTVITYKRKSAFVPTGMNFNVMSPVFLSFKRYNLNSFCRYPDTNDELDIRGINIHNL